MSTVPPQDKITLRNFHTTAILGLDAWSRPSRPQPVTLSISLGRSTANAGISDDISHTFSYGTMCKEVQKCAEGKEFRDIDSLLLTVLNTANEWPGEILKIEVVAPTALLRCGNLGVSMECSLYHHDDAVGSATAEACLSKWTAETQEWCMRGLRCACIIGVNPPERKEKQDVVIELRSTIYRKIDGREGMMQIVRVRGREAHGLWRNMVQQVYEVTEASSFQTLEALAALIAKTCLEVEDALLRIKVNIEKPSALTFVDGAGVEITRDRNWLHNMNKD